jgi:hypothetical protein
VATATEDRLSLRQNGRPPSNAGLAGVGFIVTNMSRPAERVVAFYNKRGTCEQWIKDYVAFQMAQVAIPRQMFQEILRLITEVRPQPPPAPA